MNQTVSWTVVVYFTGLVLFVKDPDTERVTHALLLDGRNGDQHVDCIDDDVANCDTLICKDFKHFGEVSWKLGAKGSTEMESLEEARLSFRWFDSEGVIIPGPPGARPQGEGVDQACPSEANEEYFAWVKSLGNLTPLGSVKRGLLRERGAVPNGLVAQVRLEDGWVSTEAFGFAADPSKVVKLPFSPRLEDHPPAWRGASAELVALDLERPDDRAERLVMYVEWPTKGQTKTVELIGVGSGRTEVWISNQPEGRCKEAGTVHPGRRPRAGAQHFRMLYASLMGGDTFPDARKPLPWIPAMKDPSDICQRTVEGIDPGLEQILIPDKLLGMINRPLCIPGSGYAVSDGK